MTNEDQTLHCPVCGYDAVIRRHSNTHIWYVNCPVCGSFAYQTGGDQDVGPYLEEHSEFRSFISAYTRERTIHHGKRIPAPLILVEPGKRSPPEEFAQITVEEIVKTKFPKTISSMCDHALLNLGKLTKHFGDWIDFGECDYPVLFGKTMGEMRYLSEVLAQLGWIREEPTKTDISVLVTAPGWERIAELEREGQTLANRQAFVAMDFDPEMNAVWLKGLEPGIKDAGFDPLRIDFKEHNEFIPDEIISEIRRSRFVVADVTGQKHGVYFEAGFALGLHTPVIWTCRENEIGNCHFDTRQYNHVLWQDPEDLRRKLLNRIRATIV